MTRPGTLLEDLPSVIADRYEVVRVPGEGGMGLVCLGTATSRVFSHLSDWPFSPAPSPDGQRLAFGVCRRTNDFWLLEGL